MSTTGRTEGSGEGASAADCTGFGVCPAIPSGGRYGGGCLLGMNPVPAFRTSEAMDYSRNSPTRHAYWAEIDGRIGRNSFAGRFLWHKLAQARFVGMSWKS